MNDYMTLKEMDPTNHHIFSHVNEEYFYKGLERAKVEGLYVDQNGRIDLHKLIQLLWGTFADGKYVMLPNHECRKQVTDFIKNITACEDAKIEAVAEKILDAKPKRKSRAKPKVDEVMAEMSTEDLKEEVKPSTVSDKSYKVILKPTVIIPTIGLK